MFLSAATLASTVAPGCARKTGSGGAASRSVETRGTAGRAAGVFRDALTAEPTTFDPAKVSDGPTIGFLMQVYEGLVGWGDNNNIVPLIAAEMPKVSDGGKTYTFRLRPGVTFSNGRAVSADDVKYSLTRALDPKLNSPVVMDYLNDIEGAEALAKGQASELTGVKIVDTRTVQIRLVGPRPYFLGKLTYPTGYVLAKEEVEKGPASEGGAKSIDQTNTVGTGPFKLASYVPQSKIVLSANAGYWAGKPKITSLQMPIVLDALTRRNMYQSGQLDILTDIPKGDYEQDSQNPKLKDQIKMFARAATFYLALNQTHYAPFKDKRVRQAVAHAIDKDSIIKNALQGINHKAEGIVPEGVPGFDPTLKGMPFDLAKAKALLAEAGFPDGKGLPPLTLAFRQSYPDYSNVAQVVQQQLVGIGINVQLKEMDWATLLTQTNDKQIDFFHMRWSADYLDPQDFLSLMFHTNSPENRVSYSNPQFDDLCDRADGELNNAKRMALYHQAERIVVDDAPWVPIYFQRDVELIQPYVKGIRDSLMGHLPYTTTTVD